MENKKERLRILIFLHGTCIMHLSGKGRSRKERVQQVIDNDDSLYDFASYIPIGYVVEKLIIWEKQGAKIMYLSSHKRQDNVEKDKYVLNKYQFPKGPIFYRHQDEWDPIIIEAKPDVIIEDDCESIGGESYITYQNLKPQLKSKVKSIIVKEFGGIDHLPDDITKLLYFKF